MSSHAKTVNEIARVVKSFYAERKPFRIYHGSSNSTRPAHSDQIVDISALSNVLEVDTSAQVTTVEPNVPMDRLVQATLAHGMIPPVVMEFPGITVGGGYAGSAGESSSFKYGYFDQTVQEVEMILGSGEVVTASATQNVDLFKASAGAVGTLGITTRLKLKLIPAKRFVKLAFHRYSSIRKMISVLRKATTDSENDYVDGILYSESHGVLMIGKLTDEIPSSEKPQTFGAPGDPWFYLHVKEKMSQSSSTEYIPIAEYLFRYDRGGFWVGAEAFKYFGFVPFNKYTRWFLDDFMHTRMMFRALKGSNMSFTHMVQDVSLPYETVEDFIEYTAQNLSIWPLWLCPLRSLTSPTFHPCYVDPNTKIAQPMLNIGVWGAASRDLETFVQQNRSLEARLTELGGRKVLYSHTYYTEDDFWRLYDRAWYNEMREKYSATSLPTVYDKVTVDPVKQRLLQSSTWLGRLASCWPFAGFFGIWHALKSKDYLMQRNLSWMRWKL